MSETMDAQVAVPQEKKCAVVLVLDVSGSMESLLGELQKSVQRFLDAIASQATTKSRVEIEVITFSSVVDVVRPFGLVGPEEKLAELRIGGSTKMDAGMQKAIQDLKDRWNAYKNNGVGRYAPQIFLLTDGVPDTNDWIGSIASELEQMSKSHRLNFWAVGMGNDFDKEMLKRLAYNGKTDRVGGKAISIEQNEKGLTAFVNLVTVVSTSASNVEADKGQQTVSPQPGIQILT